LHARVEVAGATVELRDRFVEVRVQVSPVEGVIVVERLTVPVSPLSPETTIVELARVPVVTVAGLLAAIVKSCMIIVVEVVRVSPLLVAVVVTV
jgi:hypothetical protein